MKAALAFVFLAAALGAAVPAASPVALAGEEPQVPPPVPLPVFEAGDAGSAASAVGGAAMTPPPAAQAQARETVHPDSPAAGSRLLRALAEARQAAPGAAPLSGTSVSGPRVSGASVFAAEGCPRALLRKLLADAADGSDALTALAIETELLALCRERQEIRHRAVRDRGQAARASPSGR